MGSMFSCFILFLAFLKKTLLGDSNIIKQNVMFHCYYYFGLGFKWRCRQGQVHANRTYSIKSAFKT